MFPLFKDSVVEFYNNDTDYFLNHLYRDNIVIHNSVSSK